MTESPSARSRVLVLTADAGFGHRRAAGAVAKALRDRHGDRCECHVVNPLLEADAPLILRRPQLAYDATVRRRQGFFRITYEMSEWPPVGRVLASAMVALLSRTIRRLLEEIRPDAVLSTYHIYSPPLGAVLRSTPRRVPSFTAVTDLADVHPLWFRPRDQRFLVASEEVRRQAVACGVAEERILVTGIPIDPDFAKEWGDKAEIRRELGLATDRVTVLAVGSRRASRLLEDLLCLNGSGLPIQLIAVAGGDAALYDELRRVEWRLPVRVYDYVECLPQLMRAADVLLSKAGGLIISEGLACGLPALLTGSIPGQEDGNVSFVQRHGAGARCETSTSASEILRDWLRDGGRGLREASLAAARLGRPAAADRIADALAEAAHGVAAR